MRHWPLVLRSTDNSEDRGLYQAYGPGEMTLEELVSREVRISPPGLWLYLRPDGTSA
jgi:hypothetical protein